MGPPPSSSQPPRSSPPPSSPPGFLSAADDWFLQSSDRDTQIFTQALTRELCSSREPAPSSLFPSTSCSSSSSLCDTFSLCLEDMRPWQSRSFEALRALQQQPQQQQHNLLLQQQKTTAILSSMRPHADEFSPVDQNPLQQETPLYSSSPLSAITETPASPFSTLSTNSAIATENLLADTNPSNRHYHDSQDGRFAGTTVPSLKPPEVSSMYNDSVSSKAASKVLSSQASVGAGGGKVNKRRNRANNKAPVAVLSADTSNFRALVQQLTGIPSSSAIHPYTQSGIPLLKPQSVRHPFTQTLNLPTLDTSACFFGPNNVKEGFSFAQRPHQLPSSSAANILRPFPGVDLPPVQRHNAEINALRSHMPPHVKQSVFNDQGNAVNHIFSSSLPSLWNSADNSKARGNFSSSHEGEQISVKQYPNPSLALATLDSLLMEEHVASKSSFNAVDAWLSFDGAHVNHGSNTELARMA